MKSAQKVGMCARDLMDIEEQQAQKLCKSYNWLLERLNTRYDTFLTFLTGSTVDEIHKILSIAYTLQEMEIQAQQVHT